MNKLRIADCGLNNNGTIRNPQSAIDGEESMRVISGRYRGRKLFGPRGRDLRPTSDRLRETLFNILSPAVSGSVVLDVFAGTGAIGIEALSRGAQEVVFIESGREGCALIRQNLEACGITSSYRLIREDAFTALRQLCREGFAADIVFLDPPYAWQPYEDLLGNLSELSRPSTTIVFEHDRRSALPESGSRCTRTRVVRQGDHCLSFYIADCGLQIAD